MKAADEVLAFGQVHAGLAADGRINLREERRGHLDIGNAAHENRGEKSAHVAHDAAAQRDQQRAAIAARRNHLAQQLLHAGHGLVFFARGQKKRDRRLGKGSKKSSAPKRPDLRRGENKDAARQFARDALDARRERAQQAAAGKDVVSRRRSSDSDGLHRIRSR